MKRVFSLAAALCAACSGQTAIAADTITATHVFPASLIYSRSFLEYVKKANEAGKGVFTIQVRGGPEAIGMMEQPRAARNGVVDMVYSPCAFYAAVVPECDAVSACTIDGPTARKNGGMELLNQIHQKRAGIVQSRLGRQRHPLQPVVDQGAEARRQRPHRHQGLQGARQPDLQRVPHQLPRRAGHQPQLARALHRARARHGGHHRLDADRPDGPQLGPLPQVPHPAGLLLHRPAYPGQPEEVAGAVAEDRARSCSASRSSTRPSSLQALQALWQKEEAELKKRGIKTVSQSPEASKRFYRRRARREPPAHEGAHGEGRRAWRTTTRSSSSSRPGRCPNKSDFQGVRRHAVRHGVHGRLPDGGDDGGDHARRRAAQPRLPELGAFLHLHRVRAAHDPVPGRAVAGAREGPHLRRDPADVAWRRPRARG